MKNIFRLLFHVRRHTQTGGAMLGNGPDEQQQQQIREGCDGRGSPRNRQEKYENPSVPLFVDAWQHHGVSQIWTRVKMFFFVF